MRSHNEQIFLPIYTAKMYCHAVITNMTECRCLKDSIMARKLGTYNKWKSPENFVNSTVFFEDYNCTKGVSFVVQ